MTMSSDVSDYGKYLEAKSVEEKLQMLRNIDPHKFPDRVELLKESLVRCGVDPALMITETSYQKFRSEKRNMILVLFPFMLMFAACSLFVVNLLIVIKKTKMYYAPMESFIVSTGVPQKDVFVWYNQDDKSQITSFEFVLNGKRFGSAINDYKGYELLTKISGFQYDSISVSHYVESDDDLSIEGLVLYRDNRAVNVLSPKENIPSGILSSLYKIALGIGLFGVGLYLKRFLFKSSQK